MVVYCTKIQDRFAWLKNGVRVCFLGAHKPAAIDGFTAVGGWGDEIKDWKRDNNGIEMTEEVARSLLSSVPDDFSMAVQRAIKLLTDKQLINDNQADIDKARRILLNDVALKKLIVSTR